MAHELEMVDGQGQMVYVGETPWHGLGKKIPADLTPEQVLITAGLDWTVEKRDLYYETADGPVKSNQQALIRTSDEKLLTVISKNWKPVQNLEAFQFFNDFVMAGDMEMHTAGSLKNGKMVWAMAHIKESFELFGGDKVEGYLLFSNPHEFGRSIDIRFTPVRVVCNNTLTMALDGKAKHAVKLNHRSEFDGDVVKETLGIAKDRLAGYREQAKFLGSKRYNKETLTEYFNRVFPPILEPEELKKLDLRKIAVSANAEEAMSVIHLQPGAKFAEGSWWQAFNTVTYMTDHTLGRSKDTRLTSAWYGLNRTKKERALNLALEYSKAA
jgi:phage/plasmid-like protein (TIGR03299 family)